MSSSFIDSFDQLGGESPSADFTQSFDDAYLGSDQSQRLDSFSNVTELEPAADDSSPPPIYVSTGAFSSDPQDLSQETNDNGPILPPPAEMEPEEGYALREWRRQNAIRLEEKEKREKELLSQIIDEADEYKVEFHKKRQVTCTSNIEINREKEKLFLANQEKFQAESGKNYWKAIAELIPNEVPKIEKKGKKEKERKPSVVVVQGPKPGKPTDLARMRQILVKLKHNSPPHLKPSLPAPATSKETIVDTTIAPEDASVAVSAGPVAVA
ncbi:Clathrin light chain 2 [Abeliophyllum distichum]|uniref:Clathrin light chain n=1 Tax=Abeliophyllum distichum TaxID=126358 RepID=A0ABD1UNA1_9LAMI